MLGFDAIGKLAIGQVFSPRTFSITAVAGAFTLTGQAVSFQTQLVTVTASYVLTGYDSARALLGTSDVGSFAVTGYPATLSYNVLWTESAQESETWTEKVYGT